MVCSICLHGVALSCALQVRHYIPAGDENGSEFLTVSFEPSSQGETQSTTNVPQPDFAPKTAAPAASLSPIAETSTICAVNAPSTTTMLPGLPQIAPGPKRTARGGGTGQSSKGAGGNYVAPAYLHRPSPVYPSEARKNRWEGLVLLAVEVSERGIPSMVKILRSSGHLDLDEAAVKAVSKWVFYPARAGSRTMAAVVEVPVRFSLQ